MNTFIEIPASKKSIGQRKFVFSVGINDADYITSCVDSKNNRTKCPYYKKWASMLQRCYSANSLEIRPTYKDCTVCDEWLLFSNFKSWMANQDWDGMELDKDILFQGNKVYSPSTCLFVSPEVNSAICFDKSNKSKLPSGVTASGTKFIARGNLNGGRVYLGVFNTIDEASAAYAKCKIKNIISISHRQSDIVKKAMVSYILS